MAANAIKALINRITGPGRPENKMTTAGRAAGRTSTGAAGAFPGLRSVMKTAKAAGGERKNPKNLKTLRRLQTAVGTDRVTRSQQTRLVRGGLASSIVKRGAGGMGGGGG